MLEVNGIQNIPGMTKEITASGSEFLRALASACMAATPENFKFGRLCFALEFDKNGKCVKLGGCAFDGLVDDASGLTLEEVSRRI